MLRRLRISVWFALPLLISAGSRAGAQPVDRAADQAFSGGAAAYVVEVQGRRLWSHRADRPLPPASLTKIMTALLVLESRVSLDEVVTVSGNAQRETGTVLQLRAGERMHARDLLAAMLLLSANDACLALAEFVGGDATQFVARMNRRARELGMRRSNFTNACGHDAPTHRASAGDLAVLTAAALQQPVFTALVQTVELRVSTLAGREFALANKNELVGRYPGAIGVKSGFTPRAGKCLVALAERDGVRVLLVVLDAKNRWWDTVALLDRAFAQARPASVPAS